MRKPRCLVHSTSLGAGPPFNRAVGGPKHRSSRRGGAPIWRSSTYLILAPRHLTGTQAATSRLARVVIEHVPQPGGCMTKRQLFLVAGTIVLAGACQPLTAPFCETDEVTGEAFCASKSQAEQSETPA